MKRIALITGTTSGIGKSIAEKLKQEYYIIGVNRRSDKNVDKDLLCDLSSIHEIQQLSREISKYKIDILINNAGGSIPCDFRELTPDKIIYDINLNFLAPTLLMQAVIAGMVQRSYGKIINISSISSKAPTPYLYIYSATKSAIDSLTKSCALTYGVNNININAICPGAIETETSIEGRKIISLYKGFKEDDYQKSMVDRTGFDKLIPADEVANVVCFLISEQAKVISGQCINVCGTLEMN